MLGSLAIGILLTLAAVWGYHRYSLLEGQLSNSQDLYSELHTKFVLSEQSRMQTIAELAFLKQSMETFLSKPVFANLNEAQIMQMTQQIAAYIDSIKEPKKMN